MSSVVVVMVTLQDGTTYLMVNTFVTNVLTIITEGMLVLANLDILQQPVTTSQYQDAFAWLHWLVTAF